MFAMLPSASIKPQSSSASSRMQGNLWKWTNYLSGWQQRWFVLDSGTLTYYLAPSEVNQGCRGSLKVTSCDIHVHPTDHTRLDIVMPGGRHIYLKASSTVERQQWVVALGTSKQEDEGTIGKFLAPSLDQQVAVKSKMTELRLSCQLLFSQVSNMRNTASSTSPDTENLLEMAARVTTTCDTFLKILSECMQLSTSSVAGGGGGKAPATPTDLSSPTTSFTITASLPGRLVDRSSQKPPTFSLSQLPTATAQPSVSLPPLLPFPASFLPASNTCKLEKAKENSTDSEDQSLPAHMVGKPTTRSPGVHSTGGGGVGHGVREMVNQRENGSLAPESEHDTMSSPRTHSRANSELFVTPTSTPTSSPPPSPSHLHTSPQHTVPPSQGAHTAPPSQRGAGDTRSQPQRIGDRFSRSPVSPEIQSFFSRAPHKFEDLVLSEDDGVPTLEFLESCRAAVPFFNTLSSTAFAPVKADINGNIEKLYQKYLSDPEQFPTLQSLVQHELHTNTHEAKNSATDALLWLKRAMEFIQVFISEVAGGEHSLDVAAGKAYTKSLRRYHNWIVRGIFSVAVRAVPYHKDFLVQLGSDGTADSNAAVTVHMADFARSLDEIITIINRFYQSHRLDATPTL